MTKQDNSWRVWDAMESYGQVFFKRATGQAPEMESSKALARRLNGVLKENDRVIDVGCGGGHYLVSLRKAFSFPFHYTGIDATASYIDLAKKAFGEDKNADFIQGDIEKIPADDRSADIVLCSNVLLHLPRIVPAVRELWRITKRTMIIRTLVGEKSFRIKQVREWEKKIEGTADPLFDENGDPLNFHYFNIYSKEYIEWLCSTLPGAAKCTQEEDRDFDPRALTPEQWPDGKKPGDLTIMKGAQQANGSILEPWTFIRVDRT